jgi:cytochrome c biogenesis protein CcmG, thiol:disulfide interchange protein DsbE
MTRSRDSRREAARARGQSSSPSSRYLLPIIGGGLVLVAAIVAIVLTGGSGDGGAASTAPPSASSGPIASGSTPVISGTSLPLFEQTAGDAALGQTIPTVQGADFSGQQVSIELNDKPKVLLFLAHWCGHCQTEVPLVQDWIDAGGAPDDVDLVSVATAIDPGLPNYPPEEWLAREGWTVPVIVDRAGTVSAAYGLTAYPFWVFVGADGTVTGRLTGELPIADLETIIAALPR